MTYLDYIVLFEKHDLKQCFSGNTTRMYLKLLHLANITGWPDEFAKPDPYVAAVCGFSINTMKECRAQLVARGLLSTTSGGTGRNAATSYRLLYPSKSDTFKEVNPSNSDGLLFANPSEFDGFNPQNSVNPSKSDAFKGVNPSENPSNFAPLSIDKENNTSSAASAASVGASSAKKSSAKKPNKAGANFAEIAALPLPHASPEFAEAWLTFYTTNTKQAGKPMTAFELMLKKLGKRPEGFAIVMLEAAIQGDWSGVENPGTARAFTTWQAEQASRPLPTPPGAEPEELDEAARQFRAEQAEKAAAARTAHFARWAAK
jgi:hypothetical protein